MAETGFLGRLMRGLGLRRDRDHAPAPTKARGDKDMSGAQGVKAGGTRTRAAEQPAKKAQGANAAAHGKSASASKSKAKAKATKPASKGAAKRTSKSASTGDRRAGGVDKAGNRS